MRLVALVLVPVLGACGSSSLSPDRRPADAVQQATSPAERLCRGAAEAYDGDVAAAYPMTVADVRAAVPMAPPGGADSYPDGWESLDGDVAAAKCYIDADIAKAPPPVPDRAPPPSFDRALLFAAEGVDAVFHAAGYRDRLKPEPPAEHRSPSRTAASHPVSLALFHCGIKPVTVSGRLWEADRSELLLDATNAPPSWVGQGTAVVDGDRMTYTDEGGKVVPFVPDDGVPPPPCL